MAKKRTLAGLAATLLLITALAGGCSSKPADGDPADAGTKTKLVLWAETGDQNIVKAAADYQKQNKAVEIEIVFPADLSPAYLKTTIAGNNAPDMVRMDVVYTTELGLSGVFCDLMPLGAGDVKDKFVESCWNAAGYDGKLYGMPFDANTICLMYNKQLLDKAGKKVPTTYAEMVDVGNAIKATSPNNWAYTIPFGDHYQNWAAFQYFFWLWRVGGEILNEDNSKAVFNSAEGIEALQMLLDMKNSGLADSQYREYDFYEGKVGMIDMGEWHFATTLETKPETFGVALMPVLKEGVPPYSGLGLFCYGITEESKNKQAAYDFLEFYCANKDYQISHSKAGHSLPSLKEAHSDAFFTTGTLKDAWATYFQQLEYAKARPAVANWMEVESIIATAIVNALNGQPPKEALDAAAAQIDASLKK